MMARHRLNIGWGFLPLLFAGTAILTFLVCYIIAVSLDHVIPFVPYVSDTGAYPPESCLFSQFLNLAAALGLVAIYIRYKSLKKLSVENSSRFSCLNTASFVIGALSAIGLSIVGNFQWTNQFQVHVLGAVMAFGFGTVYCWLQSYMTYKMYPRYNGLWIARLRVTLALVVTLALISMGIGGIAQELIARDETTTEEPTATTLPPPEDCDNYVNDIEVNWAYMMTTICEWLLAVSMCCWIATFCVEFTEQKVKTRVSSRSEEEDLEQNVVLADAKELVTKF